MANRLSKFYSDKPKVKVCRTIEELGTAYLAGFVTNVVEAGADIKEGMLEFLNEKFDKNGGDRLPKLIVYGTTVEDNSVWAFRSHAQAVLKGLLVDMHEKHSDMCDLDTNPGVQLLTSLICVLDEYNTIAVFRSSRLFTSGDPDGAIDGSLCFASFIDYSGVEGKEDVEVRSHCQPVILTAGLWQVLLSCHALVHVGEAGPGKEGGQQSGFDPRQN